MTTEIFTEGEEEEQSEKLEEVDEAKSPAEVEAPPIETVGQIYNTEFDLEDDKQESQYPQESMETPELNDQEVEVLEEYLHDVRQAFDSGNIGDYAKKLLEEYALSKADYVNRIKPQEKPTMSPSRALVYKLSKNFERMRSDKKMRKERKRHPKSREELSNIDLSIVVAGRNAFFEDPEISKLFAVEDNKETIKNFMWQELYNEVNCTHFLCVYLGDSSVTDFHGVVESLGYNPTAFFSDDRLENAGRIAIDNSINNMPNIDKNNPNFESELEYRKPVFPRLGGVPGIGKWMNSRLHGVVYSVRDENNSEVLLIPIHVDPKNWVVSVKEFPSILMQKIGIKKKQERTALDYHKMAESEQERYLGTGLYDLGCHLLINLLKKASEENKIGKVDVVGEGNLITTGTIAGDESLSLAVDTEFQNSLSS